MGASDAPQGAPMLFFGNLVKNKLSKNNMGASQGVSDVPFDNPMLFFDNLVKN